MANMYYNAFPLSLLHTISTNEYLQTNINIASNQSTLYTYVIPMHLSVCYAVSQITTKHQHQSTSKHVTAKTASTNKTAVGITAKPVSTNK